MKKAGKGLLIGGLVGSALASLDGAAVGLFLDNPLGWIGYAALIGGVLGGLAGTLWAVFSHRLILPPPEE